MLTLVLLMRAIDPVQYSSRVSGLLCELCVVDSMRCRYYQDLQSKYQIEDYIAASRLQNRTLNLSGKGLTYLCRLEFFTSITHLNVSNNQLQSLNSPLSLLHCLEELDASNNQVKEINGLSGLRNLTVVILDSNQISSPMTLGHLTTCTAIQKISIKLNPISSVSHLLSEMFPNAEIVY
uniref:Uncharacterized protein n=1 Tax=Ciona savignyi TaxID=51511 RepID=H2ZGZ3_CIOSA